MEPRALLTLSEYFPALSGDTLLMVSVLVPEPEMLPPSVRGLPLNRHWQNRGWLPKSETAKAALVPARTVWFVGCVMICGAKLRRKTVPWPPKPPAVVVP